MNMKTVNSQSHHIALSALFIALSYLGALIKLQGTIALDALPAFLGAIYLGPFYGGIIGFLGHFFTALFSGFPMTFPLHFLIAVLMMGTVSVFGYLYRKGQTLPASLLGIFLNGPLSLSVLSWAAAMMGLPFQGKVMFLSLLLPLTAASAVNLMGAVFIYNLLRKRIWKEGGR